MHDFEIVLNCIHIGTTVQHGGYNPNLQGGYIDHGGPLSPQMPRPRDDFGSMGSRKFSR